MSLRSSFEHRTSNVQHRTSNGRFDVECSILDVRCFLCSIFIAAILCGCVVDQEREVAKYRVVIDTPLFQLSAQPDERQPLTLDDALRFANQNNENLAIQGETYLQSLIARKRAVAAFLPTISLAPTYFTRDPPGGGESDFGGGSSNSRFDTPVLGSLSFNPVSDYATLLASEATIEQQRWLLLDFQQSLLIDVAQAFFAVLRAERSAEVLRDSITVQEERVRDIQARQKAGLARPLDVAQTEAQASETRAALIVAENNSRNGRELLALLTAVAIGDRKLLASTDVPDPIDPVESFESVASSQRQDLLAAVNLIEAARLNAQSAYGEYWPSISINVSYFLSRQTQPTDSDWSALLNANLPLFSAGLIEADVRQALSQLRQAKLSESFTRRLVIQQIRVAYDNVDSSRRRLDELAVAVSAAEQALEQADMDLRVGRGTVLERVVAQNQFLTAQLQRAGEEFDHKVAYLSLLRAAGTLKQVLSTTTQPATRPSVE